MSQSPLAPPPLSGGPLDRWLYLLWRRLTQAGQILWGTIAPGTSAEVAAVVTDETGSPGSLVFSGNPTLDGLTVSGAAFTSRGITDNATATALTFSGGGANSFTMANSAGAPVLNTSAGNMILGAAGNTALKLIATASAVNHIEVTPTATGGGYAAMIAAGDTNVALYLSSKGTGAYVMYTRNLSAPQFAVVDTANSVNYITVTGAAAGGNPTIGVSGGILAVSASVAITGVVSTSGYTVATLPAGTVGQRAYVTDAFAPAYGVAVAGGGAVTIPVFYNGAAWICA